MLFFVAAGLLSDPTVLMEQPVHVLGVVAIIIVSELLYRAHPPPLRS